ncbi:twin-arginine translocation signal domain-containing protein [Streptomyces chattanoogensis]
MTRRGFLTLAAGAGAALTVGAAGWSQLVGASTGQVLASRGPLPKPFGVPLPVPPVARPVRSERGADVYDVEQREGPCRFRRQGRRSPREDGGGHTGRG